MRRILRQLLRFAFGFRAYNRPVLDTPGPVLLVPNHVSWFDWLFMLASVDSGWRFVVSSVTAQTSWLHRLTMLNRLTFPVDPTSPYAAKQMAGHLQQGGRLILFAEGRLSRTGVLMKLYEGTGFLLHRTQARVITGYLRGASRLPFSPNPGRKKWFPRVTAHFSEVLTPPACEHMSTAQARARLTNWLHDRMVAQQFEVESTLGPKSILTAIVETARQQPRKLVLEDATRRTLTYRRLLVGAEVLARRWQTLLSADGERVGVLLPNVSATPVVLLSLWSINRVPAILNYTLGPAGMLACVQLAGLRQVITSRAFVERAGLKLDPLAEAGVRLVYLEDVRATVSGRMRLAALLRVSVSPRCVLRRSNAQAGSGLEAERTAVVLFTSGSEGSPKGVELSHANLLANIRQMLAVSDMTDTDRLFNCLPLFHSFGLTVGTLLPLVRGLYVFLYLTPLHYRIVPTAFYDRDCTVLLSTNTFLNGYARKAHPYDFRSLRCLFAGAEKLQQATAALWSQRFGVRILEGYGATECAPSVSVNTPLFQRPGSVGRLLPGMEYKLEPVEDMGEGGRLYVRGPNVMRGYLNPDADAKFKALGGWYDTGDIACVDADGYLHILGRLKRFAKVSGEMVSLTAVEDALAGAFPQFGLRCQVAILTRPDEAKGEALIAVTNEPRLQLGALREVIRSKGLSNLCAPREIRHVKEIPKLGTGKANHRELAQMIATDDACGPVRPHAGRHPDARPGEG